MSLESWPEVAGRYEVGNKNSPVAVCTNASIDEIEVDLDKVAIIGKCVTENIGIEKIIQNIVSNPNIRYLVLCGKKSKGHFISQAIESLMKNGVDEKKRIIGALGNLPFLKNISGELIERFRKQIKIVNMAGETDSRKVNEAIDRLLEGKIEKFEGEVIKIKKMEEIKATPSGWIADPRGYFLISLDKQRNLIITDHYNQGKLSKRIVGENAKDIYDTIARMELVGMFEQDLEHCMYLGRELAKAETALKNNLDYEQDKDLKVENINNKGPVDEYGWHD